MAKKEKRDEQEVLGMVETREFPHDLSLDELVQRGKDIQEALDDLNVLDREKKRWVEEHKGRVAQVAKRVAFAALAIKSGHEARGVDCQWVMNYHTKTAVLYRPDETVVEKRAMSETELQQVLPLPEAS